jgi:hypothetical protein
MWQLISGHWLLFFVVLIAIFQQTATSTSFNQCGRSVGTQTRAWCIICGSVNVDHLSLGDPRQWLKQSSLCWKKDYLCPRQLGNMTSHIPHLCCMPIVCIICWDLQLMVVQVIVMSVKIVCNIRDVGVLAMWFIKKSVVLLHALNIIHTKEQCICRRGEGGYRLVPFLRFHKIDV